MGATDSTDMAVDDLRRARHEGAGRMLMSGVSEEQKDFIWTKNQFCNKWIKLMKKKREIELKFMLHERISGR